MACPQRPRHHIESIRQLLFELLETQRRLPRCNFKKGNQGTNSTAANAMSRLVAHEPYNGAHGHPQPRAEHDETVGREGAPRLLDQRLQRRHPGQRFEPALRGDKPFRYFWRTSETAMLAAIRLP